MKKDILKRLEALEAAIKERASDPATLIFPDGKKLQFKSGNAAAMYALREMAGGADFRQVIMKSANEEDINFFQAITESGAIDWDL